MLPVAFRGIASPVVLYLLLTYHVPASLASLLTRFVPVIRKAQWLMVNNVEHRDMAPGPTGFSVSLLDI